MKLNLFFILLFSTIIIFSCSEESTNSILTDDEEIELRRDRTDPCLRKDIDISDFTEPDGNIDKIGFAQAILDEVKKFSDCYNFLPCPNLTTIGYRNVTYELGCPNHESIEIECWEDGELITMPIWINDGSVEAQAEIWNEIQESMANVLLNFECDGYIYPVVTSMYIDILGSCHIPDMPEYIPCSDIDFYSYKYVVQFNVMCCQF